MVAGRAQLFADGDKLSADVQKFVKAAEGSDFSQEAAPLEAKILLVQVTSWRMLSTRASSGIATFKTHLAKALEHILSLIHI